MIKKTSNLILIVSISFFVVLAGLIITVRIALPKISNYHTQIGTYLSQKLDADITIGAIEALWVQSKPQIKIKDIEIIDRKVASRAISINQVSAELDVIESVINLAPIFKHLTVNGLSVEAEQIGKRWVTVFSPEAKTAPVVQKKQTESEIADKSLALNRFLEIVAGQSQVVFNDAQLILQPENRPLRTVGPMQVLMENTDDMHQISGEAQLKSYGQSSIVNFALQAEQLSPLIIETPYQVYAKFENISQQLFAYNLLNTGQDVKELSLDSEVWATFQNGVISDVEGKLALNSLRFENPSYPKIKDSTLRFSLDHNDGKQYLALSDIDLYNGVTHLKVPFASAVYNSKESGFIENVAVSKLDLTKISAEISKQSLVNPKIKALVKELDLKGQLRNIVINWQTGSIKKFMLKADAIKVSVASYKGAPGVRNASGLLQMSAFSGQFDLDATNFEMNFPKIFAKSWQYEKAKGKVFWNVDTLNNKPKQLTVNSHLLSLADGEMRANGRFSLVSPFDKQKQTDLVLMIGMRNSEAKTTLDYVPPKVVGESLNKWISSAVLAGDIKEAAVVVRTGFRKDIEDPLNPSVQIKVDIGEATVNFDRQWPNYLAADLSVNINNESLSVTSQLGQIANNKVENLTVSKANAKASLKVETTVSGDINKLFSKLKTKPAIKLLPKEIQQWKLAGSHSTLLNIDLPLAIADDKNKDNKAAVDKKLQTVPVRIIVKSKLKNTKIYDDAYKLTFSEINGSIAFDSKTGLQSKGVKLSAFDYPAKASIVSVGVDKAIKTSISLSGAIKAKKLSNWVQSSQLSKISGNASYQARLDICPDIAGCNQMVINSNLVGLVVKLPKPWGKSAKQSKKLQILNEGNKALQLWRYNYADVIRGITQVNTKNPKAPIMTTGIAIGGSRPKLPESSGIHISGVLSNVDIDQFIKEFSDTSKLAKTGASKKKVSNKTNDELAELKSIDLKLNNVALLGEKLNNAWVNIQRTPRQWRAKFDTSIATGVAVIPHDLAQVASVTLSKLALNSSKKEQSSNKLPVKKNSEVLKTAQWPKVALSIDSLLLNKLNIGQWSALLAPTKSGYKASKIKGGIADTKITGEIAFAKEQKDIKSYVELNIKGGDFGTVLKQFGQNSVLESKSGKVNAQLSWVGYPWDIEQGNLNGRVQFSLKKGRIIEAGTSANFLRIFGILNLNSVIKRLKLDFSDILKSGVAFDKVTGKYYLQKGLATSQEPLKLEGDSASVEMSGTIDFAKQTLDQKMEVAIPLTSNAPLAALLLATPQVAGIAFVVDKVLGKKIAKLTALHYDVSGPWANPEIKSTRKKKKAVTKSPSEK